MVNLPLTVKVSVNTETKGALGGWKGNTLTETSVIEVKCSSRPLKVDEKSDLGLSVSETVHEFLTTKFWPGDHNNTVAWVDLEGIPRKGKQYGPKKHNGMGRYTNNTLIIVTETGTGGEGG